MAHNVLRQVGRRMGSRGVRPVRVRKGMGLAIGKV